MGIEGHIEPLVLILRSMWSEEYVQPLVLIICGLLSLLLIPRLFVRKERFPPGPFAWPLLGHVHILSHLPHQALRDLAKKHGPIIGLSLGEQRAVVVSSPELAKEVLVTHDKVCANRPPHEYAGNLFYKDDIIFSFSGPLWRKQRKICMVELFTTKRLQELQYVRQEELGLLLCRIHEESGGGVRAVDVGRCVGDMSSSLVMRLLQSKSTSEVGGENLHDLISATEQQCLPTLGDIIPWLSCFDGPKKRSMRALHDRIDKVLSTILAERKQSASHHDDLLQALLSKEADLKTASSTQDTLTLYEIKGIMMDMLAAGIHTTSLTLEWAMAELLKNPDCLHRLRIEIDTVVGKKKQITDADTAKLFYLKWIVKEVFRLHPVVPLLLPRISTEECKVQDYILPKNTLMFVNVWAIGRDETVWGADANEFKPERFEGRDMELKGKNFELLPFGSGRRICLGLPLGLSIVEVTLANLINSFSWELPYDNSIDMDEKHGLTVNRASPVMAIPKLRVSPS